MDANELKLAEGNVMYPQPIPYTFLGVALGILPLPIFYSKRISIRLEDIRIKVDELRRLTEAKAPLNNADTGIDAQAADALTDCVNLMLEFYKTKHAEVEKLTPEYVQRNATVAEIAAFSEKQMEVSGTNDFLLQQLSVLILLTKGAEALAKAYQSLLSSGATAKLGESLLTNLSEPILQVK